MESGPGDNQLLSPAPFIWFVEPFIGRNRPVAGFLFQLPGHRDTVSTNLNIGELLNLVGLSTGVVLYTMLLAMVTGTGKTKLAIALLYRLLETRRFRRVCFVVDRHALGEQAANEFKTTRIVSARTFTNIFGLK